MAFSGDVDSVSARLRELSKYEEVLESLLSDRVEPMSSSQKEDLKELVERYEEWESARTSSASSGSASSGIGWQRFLKQKSAILPEPVKHHLDDHGKDAASFLNDRKRLTYEIPKFSGGEDVAGAFLAHYEYIRSFKKQLQMDGIRSCFARLMHFDVAKQIKPDESGEVDPRILSRAQNLFAQAGIAPEKLMAQLEDWRRHGEPLDVLCGEFGPGCFFYLEDIGLFLEDFKIYRDGDSTDPNLYQQEAIQHLNTLGVKEKADDCGVSELGRNIRRHPIEQFENAIKD